MGTACLVTILFFLAGAVCELFAAFGGAQLGSVALQPFGLALVGIGLATGHVHRHP